MSTHDRITVLRSAGPLLAKRHTREGIVGYSNAFQFAPDEEEIHGLADLAALLKKLEAHPSSCIVRGQFIGHEASGPHVVAYLEKRKGEGKSAELKTGFVPRISALFHDQPLHALMIDIDHFEPKNSDPVLQPEEAAREFISSRLPECFQEVSFWWALSASAGVAKNKGVLKAHLWFWLDTPYTSAAIRAWGATVPGIDCALYTTVQPHYTAAPVFEDVVDPVPLRSGLAEGLWAASVGLVIPHELLARSRVSSGQHRPMADPRDKGGLVGAFCRAYDPSSLPELLPSEFSTGRDKRHFSWAGHGADGVYVTECGHGLVSGYGTARPGTERRCNLFDFIRLHEFGHLDADAPEGARMGNLPSFLEMRNWIDEEHPHVLEDVMAGSTAEEDFAEFHEDEAQDGASPPSGSAPTGDAPVSTDTLQPVKPRRQGRPPLQVLTLSDLRNQPAARWRVKGWIPERGIGMMFGDSNVGKSFLALALALAIARGVAWHGNPTTRGAALYVAAEGGHGFRSRLEGYAAHHDVDLEGVPFGLVIDGLDLCANEIDADRIIDACARHARDTGKGVAFVVLDTVARMLAGGDENGPEDMGMLITAAQKIAIATEAFVLLVHHSGKDPGRGARGHSSLRAAVDTEIDVRREAGVGSMTITKQRDGERDLKSMYELLPVTLAAKDDSGEPLTSAVAVPRRNSAEDDFRDGDEHAVHKQKRNLGLWQSYAIGAWMEASRTNSAPTRDDIVAVAPALIQAVRGDLPPRWEFQLDRALSQLVKLGELRQFAGRLERGPI